MGLKSPATGQFDLEPWIVNEEDYEDLTIVYIVLYVKQ